MRQLRAIRILLASLFLAASTACLIVGPQVHAFADASQKVQITLSTISISAGATLVWLLLTFLFGRIYCATACPIGTFSDIFFRLFAPIRKKPMHYRHRSRFAPHMIWIYILCLLIGIMAIPYAIEPWNIARNMAAIFRPQDINSTWIHIGINFTVGVALGIASGVIIAAISAWRGRDFCTRFCPIGTCLGYVASNSLYHIEINPDRCTSCGKCEDICRSSCVKVVSRYVDNSRCVRCFDCVAECPEDAIRYQLNRNRPATPLMRRKAKSFK